MPHRCKELVEAVAAPTQQRPGLKARGFKMIPWCQQPRYARFPSRSSRFGMKINTK